MKFRNCISVCFITLSTVCFSQTTFSNIDTLLTKTFRAVNQKDSAYYLNLLNQSAVFKIKNVKTKADSMAVLKSYTATFFETNDLLRERVVTPEVSVAYSGYEAFGNVDVLNFSGKLRLKVSLILNDSFLIKMVMDITADKGTYSMDSPLYGMFVMEEE
ncbi:MAG: hypothetical protein V4565_10085 [Bacteroidota bacterium]